MSIEERGGVGNLAWEKKMRGHLTSPNGQERGMAMFGITPRIVVEMLDTIESLRGAKNDIAAALREAEEETAKKITEYLRTEADEQLGIDDYHTNAAHVLQGYANAIITGDWRTTPETGE